MENLMSPIVDIISLLWSCCARHTSYLCKLQENQISLRTAMSKLKETRNDVQRRVDEEEADQNEPKMRTERVGGWLVRVRTIEDEVEKMLQKASEQLNRARCVGGCCPPKKCWSNHKLGKSIAKKIPLVVELKGEGDFQELTYRLPLPRVEDINRESPVGMESMFDEVWRLINDTYDKQPVSNIIGLYGPGGVGKTTLLEEINNEFNNKINSGEFGFDYVVIFVVVSKPVNYEVIQMKIGEKLRLTDSLQRGGDESSRAQKIFNVLRNMNYVLLLDDIWEDQFDKKRIGIPIHPKGNSKLIFTTRSERVCGDMGATHTFQVACLPWDKAWSLFQEKVGEKALNYLSGAHELELAKDVAIECDGLPLALITIGRAMSTKKSIKEWKDAKTTLQRYAFDFKEMRDKVLPRLKLSYDNLSETEKSCFRYCALYPEDYCIKINTLTDYWIAEGFLDGFDKLDDARNRAHTIIGSLKSACMLESGYQENYVKMHDVIRDLALWIVNDCRSTDGRSRINSDNSNKFLVAVNDALFRKRRCYLARILRSNLRPNLSWPLDGFVLKRKPNHPTPSNEQHDFRSEIRPRISTQTSFSFKKWENAERIFWDITHYYYYGTKNPPPSPNLLTLIMLRKTFLVVGGFHLPQTFFQHMPHLRVLDLSDVPLNDPIPISICELHELQYLKLRGRGSTKLGVELRKLVKLKFLILKKFGRIPAGQIANLSQLQVLDIRRGHVSKDWELEDGPRFSELDGLEQLQEVRITLTTDDVALDKFLCNRKLQMVCTYLKFRSSSSSSSSSSSRRRVLDLSNFKSLKNLVLYKFGLLEELVLNEGLLTLGIVGLPKLNNILWRMGAQPHDDHLLRSHYHQSLHEIVIDSCDALKDLAWLPYVENLKKLAVVRCEGLETIVIEFGGDGLEEGGAEGGVFRSLKYLYMERLPKLKSICRHALAFPCLETIKIVKCPELKKLPLGSGSNVNNTLQRIEGEPKWWNELQWEDETIKSKFLPYYHQDTDDDDDDDDDIVDTDTDDDDIVDTDTDDDGY